MINRLIILPSITRFTDRHPNWVALGVILFLVIGCAVTGS